MHIDYDCKKICWVSHKPSLSHTSLNKDLNKHGEYLESVRVLRGFKTGENYFNARRDKKQNNIINKSFSVFNA